MNNKQSNKPIKIDFKLVSKKMSIESALAAFISFPLAGLIAGLFGIPFYVMKGPSAIGSPEERLMIYGGIAVFIISLVPFWMLFTKFLFRLTGRYEKLYCSSDEKDGDINLYSKNKTEKSLAYRFGKWINGFSNK